MPKPLQWDKPHEHNTYEDGIELSPRDKLILLSIVGGIGFLVFLMLIGIGF